jgi:DNA segregation ATPase FtsK/SpoIIIE-like protein
MSSRSQRKANRLKLQQSTAPGTGDRLSPVNSPLDADSQCVSGESPEEFAQLRTDYYGQFAPCDPEQRFHVDNLIRNEWLLRRFFRVEAQLWEYHVMQAGRSSGVPLGEAFTKASPIFMRLERRMRAAEKAYKDSKTALERLQQAPQPQQTTAETQQLASFLTSPAPALPEPRPEPPIIALQKEDPARQFQGFMTQKG